MVLVLVTFFVTQACSRSHTSTSGNQGPDKSGAPQKIDTSKTGGQDGGGGFVKYSSPQEVKDAIAFVLNFSKQPDFTRNIFAFFGSNQTDIAVQTMQSNPSEFAFNLKILSVLFGKKKAECLGIENSSNLYLALEGILKPECTGPDGEIWHFPTLLANSPLQLRENGDCGLSGEEQADASVSSFSEGATLCLSIEQLQRIPPDGLVRELLALILHEAFHLSGYEETDARTAQAKFAKYFDIYFETISRVLIVSETNEGLRQAGSHLGMAQASLHANGPSDPVVWAELGLFIMALHDLPMIYEPIGLDVTLRNLNPSASLAYSGAAINIVAKYFPAFVCSFKVQPCLMDAGELSAQDLISTGKLPTLLNSISDQFDILAMNWKTLSTGGGPINCEPFRENLKLQSVRDENNGYDDFEQPMTGISGPFYYYTSEKCATKL